MLRLKGIINFTGSKRSICVINTMQNVSFYCDISLLSSGISDGSKVEFAVIPLKDSMNKVYWKVVDVRPASFTNLKHQKYLEAVDERRGWEAVYE